MPLRSMLESTGSRLQDRGGKRGCADPSRNARGRLHDRFYGLGLLELHPCPKAAAAIDEAASKHKFSEVRDYAQRLKRSPTSAR